MKEFIKKWMMLFGLVSVSASVIPAIVNSDWSFAAFTIQLLIALLAICLLQLLTDRLPIRIPLVKYLIDLGMTLSVVMFFGWIWNWFAPGYVWMMFAMVIPVFIVGFFLDLVKVRQDVDMINRQIKLRRQKLQEETADDR